MKFQLTEMTNIEYLGHQQNNSPNMQLVEIYQSASRSVQTQKIFQYVDECLRKKIPNFLLLDETVIELLFDNISLIDVLYRRLWETMYLKTNTGVFTTIYSSDRVKVPMLLSEAMNFINKAAPPILQYKIQKTNTIKSYESIQDVIDLLNEFLKNDTSANYMSLFKEHMKLEEFQGVPFEYSLKRIAKLLESRDVSQEVFVCEIVNTVIPFNEFINGSGSNHGPTQFLYAVKGSQSFKKFFQLNDNIASRILNVYHGEQDIYYVMVYHHDFCGQNIITDLIKDSYKNIL